MSDPKKPEGKVAPDSSDTTPKTPPEVTPLPPVKAASPDPAPVADTLEAVSANSVIERLTELGVSTDKIGLIQEHLVDGVEDLPHITVEQLIDKTGVGMKPGPAGRLVAALAAPKTATVVASATGTAATPVVRLEDAPQSTNWLSALCAIQPQRIQPVTVVTGIKASMADSYGYFELPKKMMQMLQVAADAVGEGVPDLYFELQNLRQSTRYGALVSWMKGKGSACTIPERHRFLARMQERFWDALEVFYLELEGWRTARRDSQDVGEAIAQGLAGEGQIYDTSQVQSAALALGDTINRTFSGTGVYAATALALDNDKLQKVLAEMDFRQFGVTSREQLLQQLDCAVSAEMMAAETTITRFVWNAMTVKDRATGGMDEQRFLIELASIGNSRPWAQIKELTAKRPKKKTNRPAGIGGDDEADDFEEDQL